jgi:hypothetical protein
MNAERGNTKIFLSTEDTEITDKSFLWGESLNIKTKFKTFARTRSLRSLKPQRHQGNLFSTDTHGQRLTKPHNPGFKPFNRDFGDEKDKSLKPVF